MRTAILLCIFFGTFTALASSTGLTAFQSKNALWLIDSICGDTWCEGEYNYKFKDLKCDFSTQTCHLLFSYYDESDVSRSKNADCEIRHVKSYDAIVAKYDKNQEDLDSNFFWNITDNCFNENVTRRTVK